MCAAGGRIPAGTAALCIGSSVALTVEHLQTAIIAFGAGTIDGSDVYSGASDGSTVGTLVSLNGGSNFSYVTVGQQTGMAIPLSTAGGSKDKAVMVGGCFGMGYSLDQGATWNAAKGFSHGRFLRRHRLTCKSHKEACMRTS